MSDVPHLSVTQLKMYLRCPLQYFFRYVCGLKIPPTCDLTLGRTLHQTLHDNYHQKIQSHKDMPVSDLSDIFSGYWDEESKETIFQGEEKPGKLKDEGIGLLKTYQEKVAPKVQPVEVEKEFLFHYPGYTERPLKGYIDLIDDKGFIIDHKTSKRSFPSDTADKEIQLSAYALAHRVLYGEEEKGVRLDVMVRTNQPKIQQLKSKRNQEDIDRFLRLAVNVEKAIKTGVFYPSDNYTCGICGYGEMCEKW